MADPSIVLKIDTLEARIEFLLNYQRVIPKALSIDYAHSGVSLVQSLVAKRRMVWSVSALVNKSEMSQLMAIFQLSESRRTIPPYQGYEIFLEDWFTEDVGDGLNALQPPTSIDSNWKYYPGAWSVQLPAETLSLERSGTYFKVDFGLNELVPVAGEYVPPEIVPVEPPTLAGWRVVSAVNWRNMSATNWRNIS